MDNKGLWQRAFLAALTGATASNRVILNSDEIERVVEYASRIADEAYGRLSGKAYIAPPRPPRPSGPDVELRGS